MKTIATLTMNPTIDVAYDVDRLFHTHKMRALGESCDPGGGGINVARVFVRLGGHARCFYLSGGATGVALDGLLDLHQLVRHRIPIAGQTRIATTVHERESGKEYRLIPPGPTVSAAECTACLEALAHAGCDIVVASGSLPPGVPDDFYAEVCKSVRERGMEFVLDSSGSALAEGLAGGGGMLLVKPSASELRHLAGRDLTTIGEIEREASAIIERGAAQLVAVTLGHRGAVLAHGGGSLFLPAPDIEARSAVGAGDSFLAGMVHALASGRKPEEAFRWGMAAGGASVLRPGTGLAHPDDIPRLLPLVAPG